jgi:chaperonin GroES
MRCDNDTLSAPLTGCRALNPEHDSLVIAVWPVDGWHGNRLYHRVQMHRQTEPPKQFNTMSVNIRPLADRVLVEPAAAEEKTASGIIIPDSAKEKPQRGTVVAVGPGKKDEPTTVKEGDAVLYGKYSGTELQFEGQDYMIMREADILAIL